MKIAILSQSYYPRFGGVTENVHNTAIELARRGHQVTIVTSHFPQQDPATRTPEGVEIVRIGRNLLVPFNGAFVDFTVGWRLEHQLRRQFDAGRYDIVHIHNPIAPSLPLLALGATDTALVGTFHMTGSNRLQSYFQSLLRRRVDRLHARIAVSETARACASEHFPADYDLVPNGIDVERFHPAVEPFPEWRSPDRVNVLFVGRLDPRKGLPSLLDAMPTVVKRSGGAARLLVVGHSRLRARMEASVPDALREHIRFVGAVSAADLPRWYATADVFVSPATGNESFGIVLVEAMATGRAVVCSDLPGYRHTVLPNRSALLHAPDDAADLANVLTRVIDDAALRNSLGIAGRARALEFAWPHVTDRIERIYQTVASADAAIDRRPTLHAA